MPSPNVATYDLKPEMSAPEVTDKLVAAIASGKYDAIVCNYANSDMVGHTGNLDAARRAVEALDVCIGRVVAAARAAGGEVLITADHGNAEMMHDPATGQAHTAHTLNLVPFLYVGRPATIADRRRVAGHCADDAEADGPAATRGNDRTSAGNARLTLPVAGGGTCEAKSRPMACSEESRPLCAVPGTFVRPRCLCRTATRGSCGGRGRIICVRPLAGRRVD